MATTAFALAGGLAAAPAAAADMLSIGVGGYMQQWFGMSSVDDTAKTVKDGTAQQSDSEIFFKGKLESDSGLTFSVKVELEGNSNDVDTASGDKKSTGAIDESQLTVSGAFGKVTLGAEDPASTLTHHGSLDVGVTLNCGDTHKWIGGLAGCSHNGFGTYGHGHGDKNSISYYTPRVSGVQFGATYIPNAKQEHHNLALNENETDAWAVGGNYVGEFGGANVAFSLGHYQASQADMKHSYISGMAPAAGGADKRITVGKLASDKKAWETLEYADQDTAKNKAAPVGEDNDAVGETGDALAADFNAAINGRNNIMAATDSMMKGGSKTFSNVGLNVGFGSFSFGVVYATNDGGAFKVMDGTMVVNANDADTRGDANLLARLNEGDLGYTDDSAGTEQTTPLDAENTTSYYYRTNPDAPATEAAKYAAESATNNDPNNDIVMQTVVEDKSKNWDTWGAGVKYSEGPMAVSLSHLATEWDNGDEQDATMLSMSYTLAPGVASKTSIVSAERAYASGRNIEGTAFVTGFALSF